MRGLGLAQQRQNCLAAGVVQPFLKTHRGRAGQSLRHAVPGLAGAPRGRHQHRVGRERVFGQIGADPGRILVTAVAERAVVVAFARLGLLGLGMSQQHQAHGVDRRMSQERAL